MKARILIIDDEENIRFTFEDFLSDEGYEVSTAGDYDEALAMIDESNFDLIFSDIILKGKTGIDILREIKARKLNCPVVMITGAPEIDTASEALRLGAFDYVSKPVQLDSLMRLTKTALKHKALTDEKEKYRSNLEAIFKSVKDSIITVDKDLSVIEINEAAKDICNLSRDCVGKSFKSLPKHCDGRCVDALEETVKEKKPVEIYRFECKHKLCPQQVVTVTTYPLMNNKGTFTGAVLVVRDETHLADLEREMRERQRFHNIIGKSKKMQAIYSYVEDLADVQTTVLITGESGTGKELVAEALHYRGGRNHKPLVKVNCSALSDNLLESELFGHVKGAFTGAIKDSIGRFKMADGGTILLDEIGDISPKIQIKLLRVLQEKTFERVGESTPVKVDVRMVASTNQDLREKIRHGEFREDLYYRLNVVEINLPPLRERKEDIPLLLNHFLNKFNKKSSKKIVGISTDVQKIFMDYSWPGNVRELEHILEHAFILCHQKTITLNHLPSAFEKLIETKTFYPEDTSADERRAILQALEKTAWNKTMAARLLGMSRRSIYRKIKEHKIKMRNI
ncbi:MAG: transcriptional regulator [Candidatus Scalindua rubra]|uniref:Transcriptional regulator n=1 Tax=Candidatus Scalindua rubra TaxID=1872076 RepID=A0A1E3X4P0_9BACT|nr:MAG: transcriptional regulator [Candidatus Scalindua rubra]